MNEPNPQQWTNNNGQWQSEAPAPPPQKKGKGGKIALAALGAVVLIGIGAAIGGAGEKTPKVEAKPSPTVDISKQVKPSKSEDPCDSTDSKKLDECIAQAGGETPTPIEDFKQYVKKHGTTQEKAAVEHVTKFRGVTWDRVNGMVDIATDFTGSGYAKHDSGKLIGGMFEDWISENYDDDGNVYYQVNNADGQIVANGNTNA
ncbi:hypothetical protein V7793_04875 [Streptomyces sp. KLMMK]|uniref:hypothetical protein n=1 Tax=Streptomyces sp. KLMMK TaxID=3109353 RepID=UPI003000E48D